MSVYSSPRFLYAGDTGLIVEFGDQIHESIHQCVVSLDEQVIKAQIDGVYETLPSYCSLYIAYDPLILAPEALITALQNLLGDQKSLSLHPPQHTHKWCIPVVYGGEYGMDLERVAQANNLTPQEVIELHSQGVYRVYMMGFSPGFTYLGPVHPRLVTSRHQQPRAMIPTCSVAIGEGNKPR